MELIDLDEQEEGAGPQSTLFSSGHPVRKAAIKFVRSLGRTTLALVSDVGPAIASGSEESFGDDTSDATEVHEDKQQPPTTSVGASAASPFFRTLDSDQSDAALLDNILRDTVTTKGGTPRDYIDIMDAIAFHESKLLVIGADGRREWQYFNPEAIQQPDSKNPEKIYPGRGLFMFELGADEGGKTAAQRAVNYLKDRHQPIPLWLKTINAANSVDASKLTPVQQRILFMADKLEHPSTDIGKVVSGEQSLSDFWRYKHWKGAESDAAERVENFENDLKKFQKYKQQRDQFCAMDESQYQIGLDPVFAYSA